MVDTKRLITADELLAMPEDDCRYELTRGELVTLPIEGAMHGSVASRFNRRLGAFVEARDLGEAFTRTGFILATDPDTVRGPDVSFVSKARLSDDTSDGYFTIAPDLAVEVVSPNDTDTDMADRTAEYLAAGARLVVVVDPLKRTITKHPYRGEATRLGESDTLALDDIMPGFECAAADIFGRRQMARQSG